MAQAIFGRTGEAVGWLDGDDVRDLAGRPRAFIHNGNLIDYGGIGSLGSFDDGILRDADGAVVGVLAGATGVLRPTLATPPAVPPFPPRPPRPAVPPRLRRAHHRADWSRHSLDEVLV